MVTRYSSDRRSLDAPAGRPSDPYGSSGGTSSAYTPRTSWSSERPSTSTNQTPGRYSFSSASPSRTAATTTTNTHHRSKSSSGMSMQRRRSPGRQQQQQREHTSPFANNKSPHQQWDKVRDIPAGTVRNNPFFPEQRSNAKEYTRKGGYHRSPVAAGTDDPFRELAAQRATTTTKNYPTSPGRRSFERSSAPAVRYNSEDGGRHSFKSVTSTSSTPSSRPAQQYGSPDPVPRAPTSTAVSSPRALRSRLIENPFISESAVATSSPTWTPNKTSTTTTTTPKGALSPSRAFWQAGGATGVAEREPPPQQTRGWQPPNDTPPINKTATARAWNPTSSAPTKTVHGIPAGTVKGRASLFGREQLSPRGQQQQQDAEMEEDPWIIPTQQTPAAKTAVYPGDWGEAVVPAAHSAESDDWETPAVSGGFFHSSPNKSGGRKVSSSSNNANNRRMFEEEKKTTEPFEVFQDAQDQSRDRDILKSAKQKQRDLSPPEKEDDDFFDAKPSLSSDNNGIPSGSLDSADGNNSYSRPFDERPSKQTTSRVLEETGHIGANDGSIGSSVSGKKKKKKLGFLKGLFGGKGKGQHGKKLMDHHIVTDSSVYSGITDENNSQGGEEPVLEKEGDLDRRVSRGPTNTTGATQLRKEGMTSHDDEDTTVSEMTMPTVFASKERKRSPSKEFRPTPEFSPKNRSSFVSTGSPKAAAKYHDAIQGRFQGKTALGQSPSRPPRSQYQTTTAVEDDPALDAVDMEDDSVDSQANGVFLDADMLPAQEPIEIRAAHVSNNPIDLRQDVPTSTSRTTTGLKSIQQQSLPSSDDLAKAWQKKKEKLNKIDSSRSKSYVNVPPRALPKKAAKFSNASRAFASQNAKAQGLEPSKNYYIPKAKPTPERKVVPPKPVEKPPLSVTTQSKMKLSSDSCEGSVQSIKSVGSSSVTSDIRVLRSILRRPRRAPAVETTPKKHQPVFATYDTQNVADPMQRAGLRLLSAAIIPIQTEVRRFLAMRNALTRMWALIVIQTYSRRFLARSKFTKNVRSAVKVQAATRGWMTRNNLIFNHICAIEIQRHVRGYLSTLQVYEDIYKVTIIQSFVRMKLAMMKATDQMVSAIQLQSVARGFLVRRKVEYQQACATAIQANWRCFFTRLTYQFDLLDIIIAQSVFRKRLAGRRVQVLREANQERSAIVLQTKWRSYDCTMNYLHFLADVLIAQSTVRRFLAKRRTDEIRTVNATTIQRACAGFLIRNRERKNDAATTIQKQWRGYSSYDDYSKFLASRAIQSQWRKYTCFDAFQQFLAARSIQRKWRGYVCYDAYQQFSAARTIQTQWRGRVCREDYKEQSAARSIQTKWRSFLCYDAYKQHCSAKCIQTQWRGFKCYEDYTQALAARIIQSYWRGASCRDHCKRDAAARTIQSTWRGFVCYADFMFSIADIVTVQKLARRWLACRRTTKIRQALHNASATKLQRGWRDFFYARKIQRAWHLHQFILEREIASLEIQREWRCFLYSRKIQRAWRQWRFVTEREQATLKLQDHWRKFFYARRIQRCWGSYISTKKHNIARNQAAIDIQKTWRCFVDETEYVVMKYEYYAARTIQSYWKRFWCFSNFIIALDCTIQVQAVFRGYSARRSFDTSCASIVSIQCAARSFLAKLRVKRINNLIALEKASVALKEKEESAAACIQSRVRGNMIRKAVLLYLSATSIQRVVRGRQARSAIGFYLCARTIQATWRGVMPRQVYNSYRGARKIQTQWRCKSIRKAYVFYRAAVTIQRLNRGCKAREETAVMRGENIAAARIQSAWRGFVCYTDYIFTVSDIITCQKLSRAWIARHRYTAHIKSEVIRKREEGKAILVMQKASRGFVARQRYWYVLGCTMQLQSWMRGRLVMLQLEREYDARIVLQSFVRRILARQNYLQKKFIYMLITTAEKEKTERLAATAIQDRTRAFLEEKERDRAARTIQNFFIMVKYEVDLMVRATKKRRKWKKKMKKHSERVEDDLLESAWNTSINHNHAVKKEPVHHRVSPMTSTQGQEVTLLRSQQSVQSKADPSFAAGSRQNYHRSSANGDGHKKRHKIPRGHSDRPSTIVRLHHDDESMVSGITMNTIHVPPRTTPRRRAQDRRELDEDLRLEEAFMDVEITTAKERNHGGGSTKNQSYPYVK